MKLTAMVVGFLLVVGAAGQVAAQSQLADFWGFSYEDPLGGGPGMPGNILEARGFIDDLWGPYITFDMDMYQYTWEVLDLVSQGFNQQTFVTYYTGGTVTIYEDSSFDAANGCLPNWITPDSTFNNGTLYLYGVFSGFFTCFNPALGSGTFEGTIDWTGGTHLSEIPPEWRSGWTFGGTTESQYACIPEEYDYRIDGQVFLIPVAAEGRTWSGIKKLLK
jgi:hypothetical protein